jgi:hypothetical protein
MENYINPTERVPGVDREQQIWTYRYGAAKPDERLSSPSDVSLMTSATGAKLAWQPVKEAKKYTVYHGTGPVPWQVDFKQVATIDANPSPVFEDTGLKPGTVYQYLVRAVDGKGREGTESLKVQTRPRFVEDAVVTVVGTKEVRLKWSAPSGDTIAGYHVERAVVEVFSEDQLVRLKKDTKPLDRPSVGAIKVIGPFNRITTEPVKGLSFTDTAIDLEVPGTVEGQASFTHRFGKDQIDVDGKPYRFAVYAYRVRAVNALGVESGAGPYFLTIPRSPQSLFAKEDGDNCHLKWAANPENGVRYRVYRMESPRVNGPGQPVTRLTSEPMAEIKFTDSRIGKDTRRYWVVAVDVLGQEGIPSAPAWHYRQYRKYYVPFIGEWHQ